jgi:hypothetical protein
MSKSTHSPAHAGHPNGGAAAPETMMKEAIRHATAGNGADTPAQPHYDQNLRFDTPGLRYPVGDAVALPPTDGSRVRLGLDSRNNQNLAGLTSNHIASMVGNAYFPTPLPPAAEFDPVYADFQSKLNAWLAAQTAQRDASTALEASRVQMVIYLNARAAYVQSASNGNTNAIVSSGFEVRAVPTPVGELAPPTDLKLDLNGTPGVAHLTWKSVLNSRGYNIQSSPAETMARNWQPYDTTTQARLKCTGLEVGKVYAFRIAAVGGNTGLSDWSAEVVRMAA